MEKKTNPNWIWDYYCWNIVIWKNFLRPSHRHRRSKRSGQDRTFKTRQLGHNPSTIIQSNLSFNHGPNLSEIDECLVHEEARSGLGWSRKQVIKHIFLVMLQLTYLCIHCTDFFGDLLVTCCMTMCSKTFMIFILLLYLSFELT